MIFTLDTIPFPADPGKYINRPTRYLAEGIEMLLQHRHYWEGEDYHRSMLEHPEVTQAVEAFKEVCQKPPAIVEYVKQHTDPAHPERGFTKRQIELLMAAMIFRSSSTYSAIPLTVSELAGRSMHAEAPPLNANAMEETGDKTRAPHATLLYESFAVLGAALGCNIIPNPVNYPFARYVYRLREKLGDLEFGHRPEDYQTFRKHIHETPSSLAISYGSEYDLKQAAKLCDMIPESVMRYHDEIMTATKAQDAQGGLRPEARDPYHLSPLALNLLELAVREASSVDEKQFNRLSYIGAWGEVVQNYLGYVGKELRYYKPELQGYSPVSLLGYGLDALDAGRDIQESIRWRSKDRAKATAWSRAHNDELEGQKRGWEGDAEMGHAKDAIQAAFKALEKLPPKEFVQVLQEITFLCSRRLELWDDIVQQLEKIEQEKDPGDPVIPLSPAPVPRWLERLCAKLPNVPTIPGFSLGGY